jgi:type IV secretion system protein VirB1
MTLSLMAVLSLAAACAPQMSPATLAAVARAESGFDPLVIGVNGPHRRTLHPATPSEAVATASQLIRSGANIDLGLGQINAANLGRLGLSLSDAFDPCANLKASAAVLRDGYHIASAGAADEPLAVLGTLSIYNTGHRERGLANGYAAKVLAAAAANTALAAAGGETRAGSPNAPDPKPPSPWDVFAAPRSANVLVFTSPLSGAVQ